MSPPNTLPRPSAPMAGRGRKRPGSCCLRRSSSCCASCTAGSRSATGPNTLKRCCRSLTAGLGYLSRARPPEFCTTPALAPPVGGRTPHRDRPGEGLGPVWQARPLVDCLPPPRRPPHEQHARSTDARHEPLLRSGPTPARLAGGLPIALSCLGLVVQLHALAPRGGAGKPRLAVPRRTT